MLGSPIFGRGLGKLNVLETEPPLQHKFGTRSSEHRSFTLYIDSTPSALIP